MTETATETETESLTRSVLEMTEDEARAFFLKGESYCSIDLPSYFTFDPLLSAVSAQLNGKKLSDLGKKPGGYEDTNYRFYHNKNGKYAWRPFQLIHPAIYVSLVHKMTEEAHWQTLLERFGAFGTIPHTSCLSIPTESTSNTATHKATMVRQWWEDVEQKSLELALDYEYVFQTDITDCYASIYTHSIVWALHDKSTAKAKKDDTAFLGNIIDTHLQDMSYRQTNGIPQGSVLMDFIAEMVLGYADMELHKKIEGDIRDYRILRYRDDYRIFVNNPQHGDRIVKHLTEVLMDMGLKLNSQKTSFSNNVIADSLKPGKLFWLNSVKSDKNLQKHLLIIFSLARQFPNSGSVAGALDKFHKRIEKLESIKDNIPVLISILADIAFKSPRVYPITAAIVSSLLNMIPEASQKVALIEKIRRRFNKLPNTGHMDIWLQRITYKMQGAPPYDEPLCKLVMKEEVKIWNNDWISSLALKGAIKPLSIIDDAKLDAITPAIPNKEVALFLSKYDS